MKVAGDATLQKIVKTINQLVDENNSNIQSFQGLHNKIADLNKDFHDYKKAKRQEM